jgi:hypothetical protein
MCSCKPKENVVCAYHAQQKLLRAMAWAISRVSN